MLATENISYVFRVNEKKKKAQSTCREARIYIVADWYNPCNLVIYTSHGKTKK